MVFTYDPYSTRLRTVITFLLIKTDFHAYFQFSKVRIQDAIPVKINISAVGCFYSAVDLFREQCRDPSMGNWFMSFHVPLTVADVFF